VVRTWDCARESVVFVGLDVAALGEKQELRKVRVCVWCGGGGGDAYFGVVGTFPCEFLEGS
jgi:hypothetical protein